LAEKYAVAATRTTTATVADVAHFLALINRCL
jgi:hypothetical protein